MGKGTIEEFEKKFGGSQPSTIRKPWLYLHVVAEYGMGKTEFSLTAPGPILYMNLDRGEEGVIEKWSKGKRITQVYFHIESPEEKAGASAAEKSEHLKEWERFKDVFEEGLKSGLYRTIIVDTLGAASKLSRLARFGKLLQVSPQQYTWVNAEWDNLLNLPMEENAKAGRKYLTNVILLARMKEEWMDVESVGNDGVKRKTGKPTGKMLPDTEKRAPYVAQVCLRLERIPKRAREDQGDLGFRLRIEDKARGFAGAEGEEFSNDSCTFQMVAMTVAPEIDMEEWEK